MPNRNFNELYDLILPYVPAVETPLVDYHIRRVVREFCRRTTLWRHRVTITTQPGVNDYLLSPYDATEGVIGGGGGGPPTGTWVPAHEAGVTAAVEVLSSSSLNYATGYDNATSIWSLSTSDEYYDSDNRLFAYLNITAPVGGIRARLVPLPLYFQGTVDEWKEFSYIDGTYFPVTVKSKFRTQTGPTGEDVDYLNTAVPSLDGGIDEYTPTPITITNGVTADPVPVTQIFFDQGYASEADTTVAFNMLLEVLPSAPAPDPEICDPYSIISVVCDGTPISPVPEDYREPFGARPNNARPKGWYSPSARVVHLYPTPDAAYTVVVDVVCALTMTPTNPVLPEFLFVDYREIIADGVIASLKILGNKPWFDPEGAALYNRRYVNAVQGIRAKLRDANQPNVSTMRGPRFGR